MIIFLWRGAKIGFVDLPDFLGELCKKLGSTTEGYTLHCHADPLLLSADHAIPLGLLINELVTNAMKYAYPSVGGAIDVSAREAEGHLHVEVSDHGVGLPADFNFDQPRSSMGFKVISGLVRQLNGVLTIASSAGNGARFLLDLPILTEARGAD